MTARYHVKGPLLQAVQPAIDMLACAHGHSDLFTCHHEGRVADVAVEIASLMGLPDSRIELLYLAAMVHDIGKLAIPREITNKCGKLSELEYGLMKTHCAAGHDILSRLHAPTPLADIVFQHHERLDGSGYPRGLRGTEILKEAQILAVADGFDAMSCHRPYHAAMPKDFVLAELKRLAGITLDRESVDACIRYALGGKRLNPSDESTVVNSAGHAA